MTFMLRVVILTGTMIKKSLLFAVLLLAASFAAAQTKKIPIILDTDIGDDIDDTWALVMALNSPELDVKLVVGDYGHATYRAKIIAKILEAGKRTEIPVGLGIEVKGKASDAKGRQSAWIGDYDLAKYPGKIHKDGVGAIIELIMNSPEPITLLCIGPVPNIAAALEREPKIAQKAKFVGMHGSVRSGYGGGKPSAEWNVKADPKSCQKVFTAGWDMLITPLDTCGKLHLSGEKYARVRDCKDPLTVVLIENYRAWAQAGKEKDQPNTRSTTLFDAVAVYLAFSTDLVKVEKIPLVVDDKGMTLIDEKAGKPVNAAMEWKDLKAFEDVLVQRVTR